MLEKEYKTRNIIGSFLMLTALILILFTDANQFITNGLMNAGAVVLIVNLIRRKRSKRNLLKDERTIKIANKSLGQSWVFTFFTLNILFWLNKGFEWNISTDMIFTILFVVMLLTVNLFNLYNQRHGE